MSHNAAHRAILESHKGNGGLLRHRYRACPQSGAGNCCCGRPEVSILHTTEAVSR